MFAMKSWFSFWPDLQHPEDTDDVEKIRSGHIKADVALG